MLAALAWRGKRVLSRPFYANLLIIVVLLFAVPLPFGRPLLHAPEHIAAGRVLPVLLYAPFALAWAWLTAAVISAVSEREKPFAFFSGALSLWVGVVFSWALLDILIRLSLGVLPLNLVRAIPPQALGVSADEKLIRYTAQSRANMPIDYTWDLSQGDLIRFTCLTLPPNTDLQPRRVTFELDANGFRNPPGTGDVDVLVLGDSFVDANFIQEPFWSGLAADVAVIALPGIGTLEQAALLREYISDYTPEIVVLAYFEGNDLSNNLAYPVEPEPITLLEYSVAYDALSWAFTTWLRDRYYAGLEANCPYPVADTFGNPLAFIPQFLGTLGAPPEAIVDSRAYQITADAVLEMQSIAQANSAVLVLAYIPQKASVHWAHMDAATRAAVTDSALPFDFGGGVSPDLSAEGITAHLDTQRTVMREFAAAHNILFVDFTPALRQLAADGETPYCLTDTHWCEAGHDAARDVLRDQLPPTNGD